MQSKFIKQDTKLTEFINNVTKDEMKRRNFPFDHEVFHIKHLTECPRRIMYRANGLVERAGSIFLKEMNIKYVKKKWLDFFDECSKVTVLDRNVLAADCNFNLIGYVDAIIQCGNTTSALLVDSLNPNEYEKATQDGGLRRQIVELMMAMWLTERENGVLLCENSETNQHFISHVILHNGIINSATEKCMKLMNQRISQQMPERAYKISNNKECNVCEYRETCWKIRRNSKNE